MFQVNRFFDDSTAMLIQIRKCDFQRGNTSDGQGNDPRLRMRVTISSLDDNLNEIPFDGVDSDAYFVSIMRQHDTDEDGSKFRTKLESLLQTMGIPCPKTNGKIKWVELAAEAIQEHIQKVNTDDKTKWPTIYAFATTVQGRPYFKMVNDERKLQQGPRYCNIGFIDVALSQALSQES